MERVLLVDDEADALEVLEWVLLERGYEVRTSREPHDCIRVARAFKPTLLLTDYILCSDLNGLDIARELRQNDPTLRVVLMTGLTLEDIRSEIEALGNVDLVHKPFDCDTLVSQLESSTV